MKAEFAKLHKYSADETKLVADMKKHIAMEKKDKAQIAGLTNEEVQDAKASSAGMIKAAMAEPQPRTLSQLPPAHNHGAAQLAIGKDP